MKGNGRGLVIGVTKHLAGGEGGSSESLYRCEVSGSNLEMVSLEMEAGMPFARRSSVTSRGYKVQSGCERTRYV